MRTRQAQTAVWHREQQIGITVIMLGVLITAMLILTPTAGAEQGVIRVQGEAEASVPPDTALVVLGVETSRELVEEAVQENAGRAGAVLAALRELGLDEDEIQTGSYRISSYRESQRNGSEPIVKYRVYHSLTITTGKLDLVPDIVDTAVAAGANQVQQINFERRDTGELVKDVLAQAFAAAQGKAQALAAAAGASLGPVRGIYEESASYAPHQVGFGDARMMAVESAAHPTPITPGDVKVTARVSVEYALQP